MKKIHFYHQIIEIQSLFVSLEELSLNEIEKKHLGEIIDSSLHHKILDVILSELSEEDKDIFLRHLQSGKHDKIWEHLKGKVANIEDKIKNTAHELRDKMHKDIKESHTKAIN